MGKESTFNAGDAEGVGFILGWENPLEEVMATHSSILAQRIQRTEEPGEVQSTGSRSLNEFD